jgi:hypothetical protein
MRGAGFHEVVDAAETTVLDLLPLLTGNGTWGRNDLPCFDHVRFVGVGEGSLAAAVAAQVLRSLSPVPVELSERPEELTSRPAGRRADGRRLTVGFAGSYQGQILGLPNGCGLSGSPVIDGPVAQRLVIDATASEPGAPLLTQLCTQAITGAAVGLALWQHSIDHAEFPLFARLLDDLLRVPQRLETSASMSVDASPYVAERLAAADDLLVAGVGWATPYAAAGAELLAAESGRATTWLDEDGLVATHHLVSSRTHPVLVAAPELAALRRSPVADVLATCTTVFAICPGSSLLPIETSPTAPWGPVESTVAFSALASSIEPPMDAARDLVPALHAPHET